MPSNVTIDGRSFAPQLRGETGHAREWVFVELGRNWYVRDSRFKLNQRDELFDMVAAPFEERPVVADTTEVIEARKRLKKVLDGLDPAGGKVDTGDGSGRTGRE